MEEALIEWSGLEGGPTAASHVTHRDMNAHCMHILISQLQIIPFYTHHEVERNKRK